MRLAIPACLCLYLAQLAGALGFGLGKTAAKHTTQVTQKSSSKDAEKTSASGAVGEACGDSRPFTVSPVSLADVRGLVPLGHLSPPGHTFPSDHIYFYLRRSNPDDFSSPTVQSDLLAPADMTVTDVAQVHAASQFGSADDYNLNFSPCRELKGYFYHITSLDPDLLAEIGPINENCFSYITSGTTYTRCSRRVSIKVTAGAVLGSVGGPQTGALDFGLYDTRTAGLFANNSRHYAGQIQTVCPIDYYVPAVKSSLEARLGSYDGKTLRTIAPVCGTIFQDIPGTAQGDWYHVGSPDSPEDPHLALVHDMVTPTTAVFSIGASVQGLQGKHPFSPSDFGNVRRDFSGVTPDGGIFCYDSLANLPNMIILLDMPSADRLRMETRMAAACGPAPWAFVKPSEFQR